MFDPYIIVDSTLRNESVDGRVVGFAFEARCGYYRRLILSMVEDLAVAVDGRAQPRESVRFTLRGRTYTLAEMAGEFVEAWEFGEPATVTVLGEGLTPGAHEISLAERLRISYLPGPHTPATTQTHEVAA